MQCWKYLVYLMFLELIINAVKGCKEIPEFSKTSHITCLGNTSSCIVSCANGYIFYDGSITKAYTCQTDGTWLPTVPRTGCLEIQQSVFSMILTVAYKTFPVLAFKVQEVHNESIIEDSTTFKNQVSEHCNIGKISINNVSVHVASFSIEPTFHFILENSTDYAPIIRSCIDYLGVVGSEQNASIYQNTIFSSVNVSKVSIQNAYLTIQCHSTATLTKDIYNISRCVPNVPVVGVQRFNYTSIRLSNVILFCDIIFGDIFTNSIYWQHNNKIIDNSKRLSGSTVINPSLNISGVDYADAGTYTCHGNNSFGVSTSLPIYLNVLEDDFADETRSNATSEITDITSTIAHIQSTYSSTISAKISKSTTELSNQNNSSIQGVSSDQTESILDEYKTLLIGIGSGCGGLIVILVIVVILMKGCRTKSARMRKKYEDACITTQEEEKDLEYDGLKDNSLYISSDQTLIVDGDYCLVHEEISMTVDNQQKYSVPATVTTRINVNESNHQPTQSTENSIFQNKAFQLSEETIEHISSGNGSNNEYAIVNKKKQTDAYAVVNKRKDT